MRGLNSVPTIWLPLANSTDGITHNIIWLQEVSISGNWMIGSISDTNISGHVQAIILLSNGRRTLLRENLLLWWKHEKYLEILTWVQNHTRDTFSSHYPLIQWQRLRAGSGAWVRLDRKLEGLSILRLPWILTWVQNLEMPACQTCAWHPTNMQYVHLCMQVEISMKWHKAS